MTELLMMMRMCFGARCTMYVIHSSKHAETADSTINIVVVIIILLLSQVV